MSRPSIAIYFAQTRLTRIADGMVVAIAVSLPWSTSATGILVVLWLLALIPILDWNDVRRELATPAGGFPVALFLFGVLGMLWADVTLIERWKGLDSFFKLLVIPLLLMQFRGSDRGLWVLSGYGLSCLAVLLVSSIIGLSPSTAFILSHDFAVPAKNASTQSGEFISCVFVLLFIAFEMFNRKRWALAIVSAVLALGFLENIFYVATARTTLVVLPVLLVILGIKRLSARGLTILLIGATLMCAFAWTTSPYLQHRVLTAWGDVHRYRIGDEKNPLGERLVFYKKSLEFVGKAPIFGHGTGSIHSLFEMSLATQTGAAASATTNPHNQTFAVAIQLGIVGALVLWAMWIAHFLLFRGDGLAEWIGLVVVVQNIVGSLLNSHLFDFVQGWVYVLGVGVAGGMALKNRATEQSPTVQHDAVDHALGAKAD